MLVKVSLLTLVMNDRCSLSVAFAILISVDSIYLKLEAFDFSDCSREQVIASIPESRAPALVRGGVSTTSARIASVRFHL